MANVEIGPEEVVDLDPFDGNGKSIKVPHQNRINVSQLAEEIGSKHGSDVNVLLVKSPNGTRKVWVTPNDVDGRMAAGVIKSHKADPEWGLTQEQKENKERINRLRSGEQLSIEDQNHLLRELLAKEDS